MEVNGTYACVICGEETSSNEHWFLLAANRWQDKLRILQWNDSLASQAGIRHACTASHVQELVVHWMTTGSVDYPFAQVAARPARHPFRRVLSAPATLNAKTPDIDTSATQTLGELSVHRESMQRILRESPHSLTSILDALLSALHRNAPRAEPEFESEEEELCGVGRQV